MIYLKFEAPKTEKEEGKPNKVKMFLVESAIGILNKIIPEANPDYDNKIDDVKTWLVEINDKDGYPNREIGIDENGFVIMTMPDDKNYGYWTDNNLKENGFKQHFKTFEIGKEMFDKLWDEFERRKKY